MKSSLYLQVLSHGITYQAILKRIPVINDQIISFEIKSKMPANLQLGVSQAQQSLNTLR